MKKSFRASSVLTAVTAILFMMTACSGNNGGNGGNGSTESSNSSSEPTEQASDKPETVEIVVWDKPHADDPGKANREKQFADFEAKYPHIKVTHMEQTKEKEREQFMTAVAGGKQPDAYFTAYPDMETYIKQGVAADITDMWNSHPDKDNFLPSSLDAGTVDGRIYGIPNSMYVTALMYNKQMFADAGLDPAVALKDWNSFGEAVQKLTDPAKNQYGYAILGMDWADWFFEYYVWQAGGDLTEKQPDGTVKLTFTSDATVKAMQYYKDLKWKYKATQKNVVQSLDDNQKDFYTGRAATTVAASDWFGTMVTKGMDITNIGFAPLPAGPSGTSPAQVGGNYWIINPKASPEKQKAAFTYAMYFSSKEVVEEGLQFNKDNGIIPNLLMVRTDIDMSKYVEGVPVDLVEGVRNAAKEPHLEYFLKSRLSPYIVKPIQNVLLDEKADPLTLLKAAQELAQKEVIDPYNSEIKK